MKERKPGVFLIRISLGKDSVTKKRLYHTETFKGSETKAKAHLRQLLNQFDTGTLVKPTTSSFNEVIEQWLGVVVNKLSRRTHEDYKWLWDHFVKHELGRLPAARLRPTDVQALYNELSSKGISPSTIRKLHCVLLQALRLAVKWRTLPRNVAEDVELPTLRRRRESRAIPLESVKKFVIASRDNWLGLAFRFGLETGCRPQEYFALEWPDIDFAKGALQINKALVWLQSEIIISDTKTNSSRRTIILSSHLVEELTHHRAVMEQERNIAGERWKHPNHVFTNQSGGLVSRTVYTKAFRAIMAQAGLEGLSTYQLRHTACTFMSQAGVPVKVASERMGHSDIRLTLDIYTGVTGSQQQDATNALAGILYAVANEVAKTPIEDGPKTN